MSLQNGMLNLTNWLGNVIMPTIAGLFAAAAIYRFSKAQPWQHLAWAGLASLMCSGLLRVLESFSNQAAWNNPDRFWLAVLTLVNWVGNVLLPLYGTLQLKSACDEVGSPTVLAAALRADDGQLLKLWARTDSRGRGPGVEEVDPHDIQN